MRKKNRREIGYRLGLQHLNFSILLKLLSYAIYLNFSHFDSLLCTFASLTHTKNKNKKYY